MSTAVAGDGDVFIMSTVVSAPAEVSTVCDAPLRTITPDVVQPDQTTAATVAVTDDASTVSVCTVIDRQ